MTGVLIASSGSWPELREAAKSLEQVGSLEAYLTSIDTVHNKILSTLSAVPGKLGVYVQDQRRRRHLARAQDYVIECSPLSELVQVGTYRLLGRSKLHKAIFDWRDRSFDSSVSRKLPHLIQQNKEAPFVFLAQAGSCRKSMRKAKELGYKTVINWNIQHWKFARQEYSAEMDSNPEFCASFTFGEFAERMIDIWESELFYADAILVPSSSVKESFTSCGYPEHNIWVVPYGVDTGRFRPRHVDVPTANRLTVAFVGEIGQRKGLSYIFDVARQLPHVDFSLAGWRIQTIRSNIPTNVIIRNDVPDVLPVLQNADLFIFPSLVDGFGLVVLQALSCGLPVICSTNAGAKDIVSDQVDGFLVEPRDVSTMVRIIDQLDHDRSRLIQMQRAAREKALQYPWERFGADLLKSLERLQGQG